MENGKITGVETYSGAVYNCKAVILCTGTYLKARCIYGDVSSYTGPNGLQAANYLTDALKELVHKLKKYLFLEKYIIKADIGTDDAAKTAIL